MLKIAVAAVNQRAFCLISLDFSQQLLPCFCSACGHGHRSRFCVFCLFVRVFTMVNLKNASFVIIMLSPEGLTHIQSQIKPRLLCGEHFALTTTSCFFSLLSARCYLTMLLLWPYGGVAAPDHILHSLFQ